MTTYVIKRLLFMIPTLFGITFLTYVIIRSAPGDPQSIKVEEGKGGTARQTLTAGDQGDYRKLLHLDKNPVKAYFYWVGDFFNFSDRTPNISSKYKVWVFDIIMQRLPNTLILDLYALIIFYSLGIPLGIDSAIFSRSVRERVATVLLFLLYSLPSFWVGLNLIVWIGQGGRVRDWLPDGLRSFRYLALFVALAFLAAWAARALGRKAALKKGGDPDAPAFRRPDPPPALAWTATALSGMAWVGVALLTVGLLAFVMLAVNNRISMPELAGMIAFGEFPAAIRGMPIAGLEPENASQYTYLQLLRASAPYYLMPIFCMSYAGLAGESRYMRVGMMNVMRDDYIRTARAKGLRGYQVVLRHALPNALTPIIVQLAGLLPGLIGGSVIVEKLFNYPGLGLLTYEAVLARDYNLIMAISFVGAVLVLFGILLSDLVLAALDPRVSFEKAEA